MITTVLAQFAGVFRPAKCLPNGRFFLLFFVAKYELFSRNSAVSRPALPPVKQENNRRGKFGPPLMDRGSLAARLAFSPVKQAK